MSITELPHVTPGQLLQAAEVYVVIHVGLQLLNRIRIEEQTIWKRVTRKRCSVCATPAYCSSNESESTEPAGSSDGVTTTDAGA